MRSSCLFPDSRGISILTPLPLLTQMTKGQVQILDENVDRAFGDPDDVLIPWVVEFSCHPLHPPVSLLPHT